LIIYRAVIVTVIIMLMAAAPISHFVNKHPAFKILALSFLLLIGFTLLIEGFDIHVPKGYVYFAMAFALLVDVIQMKVAGKKSHPVKLNEHYTEDSTK
jgi:predicted tellurium resistance membrane protein TerC